jgi:hypothetical protein
VSERIEDDILAEARRAISVQVGQLDELRSRTGLLLAAAALSGSFLGSTAASGGISLDFWGGVAVIAFTVGVASCMVVLWPPKDDAWTFVTGPKQLIKDWVKNEQSGLSMQLFLAECLEDHYDANAERLKGLYRWFQVAAFSVGASVILGCMQLAMGG